MSSTSKTTNLQLNQWQRSDSICMDDFNADNVKIDAAVKAAHNAADDAAAAVDTAAQGAASALAAAVAAFPVQKLKEVTTTQDAAQVDIDVSTIDFTKYAEIKIVPYMVAPAQLTANLDVSLRVNDVTAGYNGGILDSTGNNATTYSSLTYWRMNCASDTTGLAADNTFFGTTQNGFVSCVRHSVYFTTTGSYCRQDAKAGFLRTVRWSGLTKLNFYVADGTIPAGTRFVIYGLK